MRGTEVPLGTVPSSPVICVIHVLEEFWEEEEERLKIPEEETNRIFSNLMKIINPHIQEAQWTPNHKNQEETHGEAYDNRMA